jgi:hypothetical protein
LGRMEFVRHLLNDLRLLLSLIYTFITPLMLCNQNQMPCLQ